MKRIASFLAAFAVLLLGVGPVLAAIPPIPPPASSKIVGPAPLALRQAATGSSIPTYNDASVAQFMCRSSHTATSDISAIKIEAPNFFMNSAGGYVETGSGSSIDYAEWVEYPKGTITPILYASGGSQTGTATSGSFTQTDLQTLPTTIPKGAKFGVWTRGWGAAAGRVLFSAGAISSPGGEGEGCQFSGITASSTPTSIGAFSSTGWTSTVSFRPSAILAYTTQNAYFILGDSRQVAALGDGRSNGCSDLGEVSKSLGGCGRGGAVAYISYGQSGLSAGSITTLSSGQRAHLSRLAGYATISINQLGINDNISGASLATIQGYFATVKGYTGNLPMFLTTKLPVTTGAWTLADLSDQTVNANNTVRNSLNDWIRTPSNGYAGYFEVADSCESARNSGKWKADGTAQKYTFDGVHAAKFCYDLIRDNGVIQIAFGNTATAFAMNDNFKPGANDNAPVVFAENRDLAALVAKAVGH